MKRFVQKSSSIFGLLIYISHSTNDTLEYFIEVFQYLGFKCSTNIKETPQSPITNFMFRINKAFQNYINNLLSYSINGLRICLDAIDNESKSFDTSSFFNDIARFDILILKEHDHFLNLLVVLLL